MQRQIPDSLALEKWSLLVGDQIYGALPWPVKSLWAEVALGISRASCIYPTTLIRIYNQKVSLSRVLAFAAKAPLVTLGGSILFLLQEVPKDAKMWPLV